ncbi:uncharacterized protein [Nicotiana sylvestris]|uniref:uncharacterized protein n=1 Tax=Nicotiana sylvestris TaxID=4096 RepID=UPI00388C75D5
MSVQQCQPLLEKMIGRIQSWTTKFLSYAGRVQLIRSVLLSIQVYWSQIFLLPKKLIHLIESMCRRFLWTGSVEATRKAPISWDRLYWPKAAGGLNLMDIGLWNKAAICKLLWNLCKKKDKMWVQWVHVYYKKYNPRWGDKPKQASWVIQKIFKAKKYFEEVGYTEEDVLRLETFPIKTMYLKQRGQFSKVSWRRLICNNSGLPKWIFIMFLAAHRRLQTRDRLRKWGCVEDDTCPLCNTEVETTDHLFFTCSFSTQIWTVILEWLRIYRQVMTWEHELKWAKQHYHGRSANAEIYKMMLAGSIYYKWQERNARKGRAYGIGVQSSSSRPPAALFTGASVFQEDMEAMRQKVDQMSQEFQATQALIQKLLKKKSKKGAAMKSECEEETDSE